MFLSQSYKFPQGQLIASKTGILEATVSSRTGDRLPVEKKNEYLATVVPKDNITIAGDIVSFVVNQFIENIINLYVGTNKYKLTSDRDNLQPGEYYFDWESKIVILKLNTNDNLNTDLLVYNFSSSSSVVNTTEICLGTQPLLHKWNATGSITINWGSLGSHPSFSFEFQSCKDKIEQIKAELANGTQHQCFGYKWVVNNLAIAERAYQQTIYVSVSLIHFLASHGNPSRSPLDKPTKLKKLNGNNSYLRTRSVADFAKETNINYRGELPSIKVSRTTSSKSTTTIRSLIENYAITSHGFVFYSSNGIEIRSWANTKTHIINESDLRTKEVAFNYQGHGSWLNKVKLYKELRNVKIDLNFDEDAQVENQGVRQEWSFENCDDLFQLYNPAREVNGILRSPVAEELRSPLINFDSGSAFTKKAIKTTYVNGTPTFEQEILAGYAFSSADDGVYRIEITNQGGIIISLDPLADPQNYWKTVRQTTTDWVFDGDGYLTDIRILGTELSRLQQETDKLEAVTLKAQAYANATDNNGITVPDPSLIAQSQAYQFNRNLPVTDTTKYYLAKHRDYFNDVVEPDSCEDDFVEPKFVTKMQRSQENYFVAANPKNNDTFTYPPIVSGRYKREVETTKILSQFPEKYETRSRAASSEGENFKNAAATGNTQYHEGKPSVHKRLDLTWDYENTGSNNNFNYDRYKDNNYYLSSPGVIFGEVIADEGSKSYPDIDNPFEVSAIAETELSIENTQNALTTSLDLFWRDSLEVGDFALFRGRLWKVLSKGENLKLGIDQINCDRFEVQLGLYLKPSLQVKIRKC